MSVNHFKGPKVQRPRDNQKIEHHIEVRVRYPEDFPALAALTPLLSDALGSHPLIIRHENFARHLPVQLLLDKKVLVSFFQMLSGFFILVSHLGSCVRRNTNATFAKCS